MGIPTDPQNYSKVHGWVSDRVKTGKFRDCTHLKVSPMERGVSAGSSITYFVPECDQRCFEWSCAQIDDQSRRQWLVLSIGQGGDIIACPSDCFCYESRGEVERAELMAHKAAEEKEKRERQWARLIGPIKAVFGWFSRLPWQTQIAIICLGVLALSPKWVPQLVTLIKVLAQLFH